MSTPTKATKMYKIFERRDPICTGNSLEKSRELLLNRVRFIEQHDLYKEGFGASYHHYLVNFCGKDQYGELDHLRLYGSRDGSVLLVCSNYNYPPPAIFGMVETPQIYHSKAVSYFAKFASSTALANFVRGLQCLGKSGELSRILKALK
jgi:hypothetical protein